MLSQAFAEREVQKTYLALALGGRKCFLGHPPGGGYVVPRNGFCTWLVCGSEQVGEGYLEKS